MQIEYKRLKNEISVILRQIEALSENGFRVHTYTELPGYRDAYVLLMKEL